MSLVPYDDRDGEIWFDGKFVPWREAKIHVLTHGLHYASCVFEGERAYGGKVFKSKEHSERLHKSAEILGFTDCYVRPLAWRGSEMMGVAAQQNTIHTAIAIWQWPAYFSPELLEKGIKLKWAKYQRPAPNTAPTASKAAGLYMIC